MTLKRSTLVGTLVVASLAMQGVAAASVGQIITVVNQLFGGQVNGAGATNGQSLIWNSTTGTWIPGGGGSSLFVLDATNAVGQQSGTSAQAFRVYNTYTSSTNFERFNIDWQVQANVLQLATTYGTAGGSPRQLVIGNSTATSDAVPATNVVKGSNAYSQAVTNAAGSPLVLTGGTGRRYYQIVTASNLSGATFTIVVNGTSVVLTDGASFTHSAVNNTEASNLAAAINADATLGLQLSALASSAFVYVTLLPSCYQCTLATNAAGGDAATSTGADGGIVIAQQITWPAGLGGLIPSAVHFLGPSDANLTMLSASGKQLILESQGTGTCVVGAVGNAALNFTTNNTTRYQVSTSGHLTPFADATYDLGTSAVRVRDLYVSGIATLSSRAIVLGTDGSLTWQSGLSGATQMIGPSDVGFQILSASGRALTLKSQGAAACNIGTVSTQPLNFATQNSTRWQVISGGDIAPFADTTYNIGSQTLRALNIFGTTHTVASSNGSNVLFSSFNTSCTLNTGSTSTNLGTALPANSWVVGVAYRVTTTITTAASWSLSDAAAANAYISGSTNLTAGNTGAGQILNATNFYSSANTFKVVTNANPGAGVIEFTIVYCTLTPPTS